MPAKTMMELLFLLLVVLFAWCAIAIHQLKMRLSSLESSVRHLAIRASPATQTGEEPSPAPTVQAESKGMAAPVTPPPAEAPLPETQIPGAETSAESGSDIVEVLPPYVGGRPARPAPTLEERLASLENLVGTRWLNWVGTLVMLAGTAFLLKFLYDRGWIGPAGRVAIGMGIGVALLILGEIKLRRLHDLFSQSVSAAGCGALFLTTFLSFKFYEFSGRMATFALLCWFAAFAVALAVVRQGIVLAFLGLLCAYVTPYLLSTGQDQAEELFAYLAILALASAAVNAARNWRGISFLCLAFTSIYYIGWFSRFYWEERLPVAAAGAAGLILLAGGAALLRGLWNKTAASTEECVVAAVAAILGLVHLWKILSETHGWILGFVLCGLTLAAVAVLKAARHRKAMTPALESVLLGLASGSLLLVIPACFEANGAMLAWALGAVIFADMGIRSGRVPLEIAAGICLLAGLWVGASQDVSHTGLFIPVANRIFLAWLCVIVAWFVAGFRYFRKNPAGSGRGLAGLALQVASSFMLIGLFTYEVIAWFRGRTAYPGADASFLWDYCFVTLFILWALYPWLWLFRAKAQSGLYALSAAHYTILGLAFLGLLTDLHHRETIVFLNPVFLAALLVPLGIFLIGCRIGKGGNKAKYGLQLYAHFLCVILIAAELFQGLSLPTWSASSREWIRVALISVAWAAYATALLGVGISRNLRPWRWFALGLLGVTLIKVVFMDMAAVRQIWRVISFLALGALLMICSYAYSRHERMKRNTGNAPAPEKR